MEEEENFKQKRKKKKILKIESGRNKQQIKTLGDIFNYSFL